MKIKQIFVAVAVFCVLTMPSYAQEQQNSVVSKVKWQRGPCVSDLGDEAQIRIPGGYAFANSDDTKLLLQAMHNIPTGNEVGFVAPTTLKWYLIFEFSGVGYVKDDEKTSLDPKAMLKSIQAANEEVNKQKKAQGWETFNITGWQLPPRYNSETHNLEWATKFNSSQGETVNWNTRLLGRNGVLSVTLVSGVDQLDGILPDFNSLLDGFSYKPGHRYEDFHTGDKVAQFGLAALILGGAGVALKTGLLAALWKIIVSVFAACWKTILIAGAASAGFLKNIFKKKDK